MKKVCNVFFILIICIGAFTGCSKEIDPKNINKEEFDKISIGMDQFQVNEIVGGMGEKVSETKDGTVITYVYKIEGEQGGSAELTYQINADIKQVFSKVLLTGKTQKGLK